MQNSKIHPYLFLKFDELMDNSRKSNKNLKINRIQSEKKIKQKLNGLKWDFDKNSAISLETLKNKKFFCFSPKLKTKNNLSKKFK